uniref:Immunoglobulin V-set domain-containing protein n=1 Tax=Scleropages formosus TaxID=113540 RepID=A0A8C9TIE5_SCLFO
MFPPCVFSNNIYLHLHFTFINLTDAFLQSDVHLIETTLSFTRLVSCIYLHSISSYNMILWYQQLKEESALKLIGYIYHTNTDMEASYEKRFNISGAGSKAASLHARGVRTVDTAVYFCAASEHSATDAPSTLQKPSLIHWIRGLIITVSLTEPRAPVFILYDGCFSMVKEKKTGLCLAFQKQTTYHEHFLLVHLFQKGASDTNSGVYFCAVREHSAVGFLQSSCAGGSVDI